jgi:hypothetical protein
MSKTYPRGSEWRKWDLHVHTPMSIEQQFGGPTQASWDSFIGRIASLPSEVKVIGITDYLFCDGYEYVLGRIDEIPNIDLIIPNIEFRLDTFSGTANNTKRHNYHVLFDPSVSVADIREQLLGSLTSGYLIEDKSKWQQTPTVRSLEELGRSVMCQTSWDRQAFILRETSEFRKVSCLRRPHVAGRHCRSAPTPPASA